MKDLFNSIYTNRKVLVTGQTGFKGSWLAFWLMKLGAEVHGFSDRVPTIPSHFELLDLPITSSFADVRNKEQLLTCITDFQPDIIFHLAAQPLVRYSYTNPLQTFETNVLGTAYVFEAARKCKSVKAVVNVTSDKAYENLEVDIAYKETDRMGGYDPYSASKGAAELIVNSYRNSFFNLAEYKIKHNLLLASARAGNVIGGGDWAEDRLIPDTIRASVRSRPVCIRKPGATRPWQHVLEPLSGYLLLGQKLLEGRKEFADGWNFGPLNNETLRVEDVLLLMKKSWPNLQYTIEPEASFLHEANLLKLDCTKANEMMKWLPVWSMEISIEKTADWYKAYYDQKKIISDEQLSEYVAHAREKKIVWAS